MDVIIMPAFRLTRSGAAGTLRVTIKNGQVIDTDGIWSESDPFVILKTNGHTCQTGDDVNDNTPEWNHLCPSWSNVGDQVCQFGQLRKPLAFLNKSYNRAEGMSKQ